MCIIVYKKEGVSMPSRKTLETCFSNNPDGAGYMYAVNGAVYIQKGFMTFRSLWKSLCKTRKDWTGTALVIHFRIATHGGLGKAMCHPFPVTRDTERLKATACRAQIGLAHNGILSLTADAKSALSDSALFARDYLTRLCTRQNWYKDDSLISIINELRGTSRLVIMSGNGGTALFGKWYTDNNGVDYSNESYKPKEKRVKWDTYNPCDYCYTQDCRDCTRYRGAAWDC